MTAAVPLAKTSKIKKSVPTVPERIILLSKAANRHIFEEIYQVLFDKLWRRKNGILRVRENKA